jgi:hypothetical protein
VYEGDEAQVEPLIFRRRSLVDPRCSSPQCIDRREFGRTSIALLGPVLRPVGTLLTATMAMGVSDRRYPNFQEAAESGRQGNETAASGVIRKSNFIFCSERNRDGGPALELLHPLGEIV